MINAETVRREMNRCGRKSTPFLCGVDFEKERGFFIENPLTDQSIPFAIGNISNLTIHAANKVPPHLNISPLSLEAYRQKFSVAHKGLLRGDSFLLNLTVRTPIATSLSLEDIFHRSQARYKIWLPERFVCFSPESFIRITGNEIKTFPMKGTIDATLPDAEKLLLDNYKETCEHYTIVDLLRNDLNMVAGRVSVKRFRYVEKIKTLHGEILQTSSEISGQLPADWKEHIGDLLFRLLPAGSISGAPKASTIRLIQKSEGMKRGYYSGVFGYFDGNSFDSAVMIRFIEQDGPDLYFRSGGGITVNSRPEEEYQEIIEKIYLPIC